ncbi:Inositol phosphosphingolipids phospholipase C [Cladobotryum mycophilum]|uniref:Inositol phosphosphingolipids phospholipase C n=1 Tax=Cladobotryum mycophilum TaxID=491253 RepID=A0ABR0SFE0_9HYPO
MSTIIEEKHTSLNHSHNAPEINLLTLNSGPHDTSPDIVGLQECWTQDDYLAIREATADILPHGKFYFAGAFGGGLAILSRWPIESSSMFRYPLNGRPTAFWRGDWYVGKGVACASVRFGPARKDVIEVFNTHTHAPYESGPNDSYICHRTAQAWEISKLINAATDRGHLVVALGDFNMLPRSFAHRIITGRSGVRDVWRTLHPDSSLGPADHPDEVDRGLPVPTADFNLLVNGATSDGVYNTWRWTKNAQNALRAGNPCPVDPNTPDPRGKRLDYIFASTGFSGPFTPSSVPRHGWVVKSASVAMTQRHPELNVSLSDHFAVLATLKYHTVSDSSPTPAGGSAITAVEHDENSPDPDIQFLRDTSGDSMPLSTAVFDEILAMILKYTTREVKQQYWRGIRFYTSLAIWVGCLVAVWFSPRNFVAFILMLVSSLCLTAGVIEGLLALLFFSAELRALKEFEWEIRTARSFASDEN